MAKATQSPGSVIRALMTEYQLNPNKMAKEIGLSNSSVRQIIFEKSKVSVQIALRLSRFFDPPAAYWLDLQRDYDLQAAAKDQKLQDSLKTIGKVKKPLPVDKKAKEASGNSAKKKSTVSAKRKAAAKVPGAKAASRSPKAK